MIHIIHLYSTTTLSHNVTIVDHNSDVYTVDHTILLKESQQVIWSFYTVRVVYYALKPVMWSKSNRDFDSQMLLSKFDFSFYIIDFDSKDPSTKKKKKKNLLRIEFRDLASIGF